MFDLDVAKILSNMDVQKLLKKLNIDPVGLEKTGRFITEDLEKLVRDVCEKFSTMESRLERIEKKLESIEFTE